MASQHITSPASSSGLDFNYFGRGGRCLRSKRSGISELPIQLIKRPQTSLILRLHWFTCFATMWRYQPFRLWHSNTSQAIFPHLPVSSSSSYWAWNNCHQTSVGIAQFEKKRAFWCMQEWQKMPCGSAILEGDGLPTASAQSVGLPCLLGLLLSASLVQPASLALLWLA